MIKHLLLCVVVLGGLPISGVGDELDWPPISSETKAWTRWWWHGNAVADRDLTVEMEKYAAAGIGGLEITPIYGVRGGEAEFIEYLSPQWMDRFEHVLREAERLGMQIDMSTGTGWPFGGTWVESDTACRNLVLETFELNADTDLQDLVRHIQRPMVRTIGRRVAIADLQESIGLNEDLQGLALEQVRFEKPLPHVAAVAYGRGGERVDLTEKIDAEGDLLWVVPSDGWTLYAVFLGWHGKMVERAGPGGEGNVLDHFRREALDAYLKPFDDAIGDRDIKSFRAFFNDSYEVDDASGNSDATPAIFAEFERRRGYDLREHLPALFGRAGDDENARVLCDYRETISDLLLDEFTQPWTEWAHKHDAITRNQAHGSPANILDLYAASDIPETEATDRIQFISAASAAHVTGKRLVSAEACTWLDEHFVGTLAEAKRWVDNYFVGGVNHICYHGTCYSPEGEAWPGRLFYASLELQPTNPQWKHFHAINDYVARCQSFLQAGQPDSDVLVYWPIHDEWSRRGRTTLAHFNGELRGSTARRSAEELLDEGFLLDFVSDRQLADVKFADGVLQTDGGASYRALVIPQCEVMPPATLERILELAEAGATVVVSGELPQSAAGMAGAGQQNAEFTQNIEKLRGMLGQANVIQVTPGESERAAEALETAGLKPEKFLVEGGDLKLIRRRHDDGKSYFIVNTGRTPYENETIIRAPAKSVVAFDPLTGERGIVWSAPLGAMGAYVQIKLAPGQSCIFRTYDEPISEPVGLSAERIGEPGTLTGPWTVSFLEGGPELPEAVETDELKLWTEFRGEEYENFSGVGRYVTEFPRPAAGDDAVWVLDLGEVHESAEVRLNGETLATLFCAPFRVPISVDKLRDNNTLEIDVANLMANRIAELDRQGVQWKKFYNVNFAPRRGENRGPGGLFDAARWDPLPSGLAGPVTLTPVTLSAGTEEEDGAGAGEQSGWKFDFEPGRQPSPLPISIPAPEGNYRITATFEATGEDAGAMTIHGEVRRLLADRLPVPAGAGARFAATVNVRVPQIADADREVRLKPRERGDEWVNWDDRITITFAGDGARVQRLLIDRDDQCPTLFLIGDSTVSDQALPRWNSWGQMLPRFFGPGIAVANHAESGESIRSAIGERRFEKLYSLLRPGDWAAIQFGHNDVKSEEPHALATYESDLTAFVAAVRERGAMPILITSMERKNGVDRDTLGGYPDAVRRVARAADAPLIDLHAMSRQLYRGLDGDLDAAFQDGTHHSDFGSYELARCVVEGIRTGVPELAAFLAADAGHFDPQNPDLPDNWGVPTQAETH